MCGVKDKVMSFFKTNKDYRKPRRVKNMYDGEKKIKETENTKTI